MIWENSKSNFLALIVAQSRRSDLSNSLLIDKTAPLFNQYVSKEKRQTSDITIDTQVAQLHFRHPKKSRFGNAMSGLGLAGRMLSRGSTSSRGYPGIATKLKSKGCSMQNLCREG